MAAYESNLAAARSGDVRAALEELRDSLAWQLDNATASVHAQLAAQYRATLADLAALSAPVVKKGSVDELKARRDRPKGRRSTSNSSANA